MRREQFSLEVSNIRWFEEDGEPETPTLTVRFDGNAGELQDRIAGATGDVRDATETDVTIRLHGSLDDPTTEGVVAITDRVSGEYLLEFNVTLDDVLTFTRAARRFAERTDEGARYRVRIIGETGAIATYEKRTLLVYSQDGELLRQHSLIPSGVEI